MGSPYKSQPLDRTLVTEFKVQVADLYTRTRSLQGSIAKKVSQTTEYKTGDANVGPTTPFVITDILVGVIISGYSDILLTISYSTGQVIDVPCSGLFILYGQLDSVSISAAAPTRITYVAS
jgi:hypothetical protein